MILLLSTIYTQLVLDWLSDEWLNSRNDLKASQG